MCNRDDDDESMLLCDKCDAGYHMGCLDPPLSSLPAGDWFCPKCEKPKDLPKSGVDSLRKEAHWACAICCPNGPFTMTFDEAGACEKRHAADAAAAKASASFFSRVAASKDTASGAGAALAGPVASQPDATMGSPAAPQKEPAAGHPPQETALKSPHRALGSKASTPQSRQKSKSAGSGRGKKKAQVQKVVHEVWIHRHA